MCIRDRLCTTRAGVEDTAQPDRQPRRTYAVADPSFDVVSKVDRQEVDNALNQAAKEIATRYDFKGVGASIAWSGTEKIDIRANSEDRAKAALEVLRDKLVKRKVSLKAVKAADPRQSGKEFRIEVTVNEGISDENAKKIAKMVRAEGPKGCLLYTSDAADDLLCVDLGGRRIIKKK